MPHRYSQKKNRLKIKKVPNWTYHYSFRNWEWINFSCIISSIRRYLNQVSINLYKCNIVATSSSTVKLALFSIDQTCLSPIQPPSIHTKTFYLNWNHKNIMSWEHYRMSWEHGNPIFPWIPFVKSTMVTYFVNLKIT